MNIGFAVATSFLVLSVAPAFAQQDAKACSLIEDSLQRLTCFDKLFPRDATITAPTKEAEAGPAVSSASPWQIKEEKSPLDDSVVYTAGLTPKDVSTSGVGTAEMFLLLRCSENTTSVIFTTSMFMISENPTVTVRVGEDKAETSRWNRSTNYKAVGLWSGAEAIPFMKLLKDRTRLAVRIQDNDRVDAEFDLADVGAPIAKIREYCKW
ncbi:type VI secretion system-associated protein TagO [Rhizobium herbae]|uniref:Type VI secretion system VasI family protein n=1 Tax=Rhizobium herbae TaxID=508661 RepID=A0ABS4EPB4_9HYPH|nr:type VI secretion system-associated protein TagO [Rhizobium herbae]MBP1859784.1 type VI secretion system VasI family protein [Rhizobium herbae]